MFLLRFHRQSTLTIANVLYYILFFAYHQGFAYMYEVTTHIVKHSKKDNSLLHVLQIYKSIYIHNTYLYTHTHTWTFQVALSGKKPACQYRRQKRRGFNPWAGRSPGGGHGHPLKYSCLENPMDRGAWWATVHRVTKIQTRLLHTYIHIMWKMFFLQVLTSVFILDINSEYIKIKKIYHKFHMYHDQNESYPLTQPKEYWVYIFCHREL